MASGILHAAALWPPSRVMEDISLTICSVHAEGSLHWGSREWTGLEEGEGVRGSEKGGPRLMEEQRGRWQPVAPFAPLPPHLWLRCPGSAQVLC
uniref:Uncharacterized protein n=1 Tax=Knipowitschia caucasica TaxID=637954 RepID=A0AAV2KE63_KNICA